MSRQFTTNKIIIHLTTSVITFDLNSGFSLLSSCSSFRDSTFDDQGQGDNNGEDGADLNGIKKRYKGILLSLEYRNGFAY